MAELTVRETTDFARRVQGAGSRISKALHALLLPDMHAHAWGLSYLALHPCGAFLGDL